MYAEKMFTEDKVISDTIYLVSGIVKLNISEIIKYKRNI